MPISAHHPVSASSPPLEPGLAHSPLSEADKLGEASRQFEAIFLRQILKAAQKPTIRSRFNPQSFSSGIYQDMMTNQLANQISQSGALGLADRLQSQLTAQLGLKPGQVPLEHPLTDVVTHSPAQPRSPQPNL